jgi:hypothetical protein
VDEPGAVARFAFDRLRAQPVEPTATSPSGANGSAR